jgi:hypothetical protein
MTQATSSREENINCNVTKIHCLPEQDKFTGATISQAAAIVLPRFG